ncbi:hypothetical protein QOZ80_5AG0400710 [Eleusine coracana subsp. coracana]|nr:hypothetical protein QOZ80_5AG0400710 [Eleusine coracana subsp. coracana]
MDVETSKDGNHFLENSLPYGDGVHSGGNNINILSRVEIELAFASEKLLNLEMLVMEIARQATDIEPISFDDDSVSSEVAESAFELDILYGIRDSEVNELDNLIGSLQTDIKNFEDKVYDGDSGYKINARLDSAKLSLKQMQELIADIRNESAKFEKPIEFSHDKEGTTDGVGHEDGHLSYQTGMQTEDQQRNVLHMLEQSIASELDLGNKLSDSISFIEDLKLKLHHNEQKTYFLEEMTETVSGRMFEAENTSELLLGTSKELVSRLNTMQFHLDSLKCREDDLKFELEESLTKLSPLEVSSEKMSVESNKVEEESPLLQDKVQELEKQLSESKLQLQLALSSAQASQEEQNSLQSELCSLENIVTDLRNDVSRAESRAQNAEIRCMQLTQANIELNEELNAVKSEKSDKADLLENKLKESNIQLEHAKAAVDAIAEQQSMLKSTMSDMEHMIDDLKGKVSKAETRAVTAESKCTLLTDTNLELSEELSFLRGRVESLEASLREANHVKMSTAKDIGIRTKIITDLVSKLALERERLHLQIVMFTKKNKILAQKCKLSVKDSTKLSTNTIGKHTELQSTEISEEISPDSLSSQTKAEKPTEHLNKDGVKMHASAEDDSTSTENGSTADDSLETVRTIEPTLMNRKYITVALLVLLASFLLYLVNQDVSTA